MPIRAKRIQYFDDRLFKAIHDAQTGELPFPEPGGSGPQGTLPLSVQAMPLFPRSGGGHEAAESNAFPVRREVEHAQTNPNPKKTAAVVQAVVAEEQRQMEMDFAGVVPEIEPAREMDDEKVRTAVDSLEGLETTLKHEL